MFASGKDRDTAGEISVTNCITIMNRKKRNIKLEPEVAGTCKLIRKKVSNINVKGVHVIFIQLSDVAVSERLPDNQEKIEKLTQEKGEQQYCQS